MIHLKLGSHTTKCDIKWCVFVKVVEDSIIAGHALCCAMYVIVIDVVSGSVLCTYDWFLCRSLYVCLDLYHSCLPAQSFL